MWYKYLLLMLPCSLAFNKRAQHRRVHLQMPKLTPAPISEYNFTTYAGAGYGHLDGDRAIAKLRSPEGIAVDKNGNVYVTEYASSIVRKITADGIVSTLGGKDTELGFADGTLGEARFNRPHGVTVDEHLNVFVTDMKNCTVRKINPSGKVETIAGMPGVQGHEDGIASNATFNQPEGIAVNSKGYLYIADTYNYTVREISPDGVVKTFAGKAGEMGNADGKGLQSRFNMPLGIAIDGADNIYIADANYDGVTNGNCTIRKISPNGEVTTIAGLAGVAGNADGIGKHARFNRPVGITVSKDGVVYIADTEADTIRKITADGTVSTIGGMYLIEEEKDGIGSGARFNDPQAITIDNKGVLFIADTFNNRVSKGEIINKKEIERPGILKIGSSASSVLPQYENSRFIYYKI
jgi:sugar lactone lactonase YvrE